MVFLIGSVFFGVGLALASNFKGIATKHVSLSSRWVGSVSPLRRGLTDDQLARREQSMVTLERLIGALLGACGLVAMVNGLWIWVSG